MESGKYYVISAGNNLTESMTKEQILSAITQAVESHTISDVDTGFVEKIKEQNSAANLKFWVGSTAQYNALATKEQGCFYLLTDDPQFEDMESDIANLQADVTEIQTTLAAQLVPHIVIYGNEGDEPVYSGDSENPAEVRFPISIQRPYDYELYEVVISDTGDLSTATDIQKLLVFNDGLKIEDEHFTFLIDNKINRIEASPELANSLRSVSYDLKIYVEGASQTERILTFEGNRINLNLSSRAETSIKYYLHSITAII